MKKYTVTIDTERHFNTYGFESYNNACAFAVKAKEIAFRNGKHWVISFFEELTMVAQIAT